MSINSVTISGNLTREVELRTTPSGSVILNFGIAVNDRRKNPTTGEWEDYANFVDCTLFGNRAESMSRILRKGMKVAINGKLHYSSWEDKDGHKRSKLDVTVNDIDLMQRSQQDQQQYFQGVQPIQQQPAQQPAQQPQWGPNYPQAQQPMQQPTYQQQMPQQPVQDMWDSEIPF